MATTIHALNPISSNRGVTPLPAIAGRLARVLAVGFVIAFGIATATKAQSNAGSLKTIDNPAGGHVVYGIFDQESTMQGAMASMLRKIHGKFGDRPQIGQFFQSRDGHTVGTFFNLTAKNQGGTLVTGMVLVTMRRGLKPAAAVLFDDAGRFKTTEPELMKKLIEAYGSGPTSGNSNASTESRTSSASAHHGAPTAAAQLHPAAVADNSASIGLPAGWQITGGGGGMLKAKGPNGESITMAAMLQNNYDPRTQQGQGMIQYMSRGSAAFTACPLTSDLVAAYECVMRATYQRLDKPVPTMRVLSSNPTQGGHGAIVMAEMDFGDGKGPMTTKIQMSTNARPGAPSWMMTLFQINLPKDLAEQEWPTINAMTASYSQNGQIIRAQGDEAVDRIHQQGRAEQERINEHERQVDQQKKDFEGHMSKLDQQDKDIDSRNDTLDRQSKAMQNYTLDQSVVQDNDVPARETFANPTADSFVKLNPDRYQIVPQQDWIRGLDY